MSLFVTLGTVESPTDLTDTIIDDIGSAPDIPEEVENSYIANLKKVNEFIGSGKTTAATNQLEAFIHKIQQDITLGKVSQEDGDLYILMAQDVKFL